VAPQGGADGLALDAGQDVGQGARLGLLRAPIPRPQGHREIFGNRPYV
jgi:hypothetical protein